MHHFLESAVALHVVGGMVSLHSLCWQSPLLFASRDYVHNLNSSMKVLPHVSGCCEVHWLIIHN